MRRDAHQFDLKSHLHYHSPCAFRCSQAASDTPKWSELSKDIPGRSGKQVNLRANGCCMPLRLPGPAIAVANAPAGSPALTPLLPSSTHVQCRERWFNALDPSICHGPFSEAEDKALLELVLMHGTSWKAISLSLPGRSENSCKNRYNSMLRKRANAERLEDTSKRLSTGPPDVVSSSSSAAGASSSSSSSTAVVDPDASVADAVDEFVDDDGAAVDGATPKKRKTSSRTSGRRSRAADDATGVAHASSSSASAIPVPIQLLTPLGARQVYDDQSQAPQSSIVFLDATMEQEAAGFDGHDDHDAADNGRQHLDELQFAQGHGAASSSSSAVAAIRPVPIYASAGASSSSSSSDTSRASSSRLPEAAAGCGSSTAPSPAVPLSPRMSETCAVLVTLLEAPRPPSPPTASSSSSSAAPGGGSLPVLAGPAARAGVTIADEMPGWTPIRPQSRCQSVPMVSPHLRRPSCDDEDDANPHRPPGSPLVAGKDRGVFIAATAFQPGAASLNSAQEFKMSSEPSAGTVVEAAFAGTGLRVLRPAPAAAGNAAERLEKPRLQGGGLSISANALVGHP